MKRNILILILCIMLLYTGVHAEEFVDGADASSPLVSADINTLSELNAIVADATLLDDGDIADSNAIGLATGATHSVFGAAGDDTIDEMFTAIDTALASYSLTLAIPLDADFTSNGLMERTGAGTYQTATSISLAWRDATSEEIHRDSDAAGADDDDENALHTLANMTTTTENSEVSDWWIESYGTPGDSADAVVATDQRYTNIFWDGSEYKLTLGVMLRGGVTTDIANYETIQFDFDTATDAEVGVNSPSGATGLNFGTLNLVTTGTIMGAINVIDMGSTAASYTVTAPNSYGTWFKQTHDDAGTVVTLPDYQAAAEAAHAKVGAAVCFATKTAYATVVTASADDKIRSSAGVLSGAAGTCTGPATVSAYACFILDETATDVGIWQQVGTNLTWTTSGP